MLELLQEDILLVSLLLLAVLLHLDFLLVKDILLERLRLDFLPDKDLLLELHLGCLLLDFLLVKNLLRLDSHPAMDLLVVKCLPDFPLDGNHNRL